MDNVPWHSDVKAFSEALAAKSKGEYEVACEHVHSCCVLLAKPEKFKVNDQWFTWIDYENFQDLVNISIHFIIKILFCSPDCKTLVIELRVPLILGNGPSIQWLIFCNLTCKTPTHTRLFIK
ncbi:hypothetical protein SLEP1_g38780 [Rubroshorea leprosula]|uniref:tRNA wybutosine-synthesis domain-containing protein n=1 Tax=Rubroshorea leprosula TaxID=152421 RepID=A0AAV5KYX3_9ROSI|nr:hypothetical protein SLEP1_g38780 [Rubroshorea leprosula]